MVGEYQLEYDYSFDWIVDSMNWSACVVSPMHLLSIMFLQSLLLKEILQLKWSIPNWFREENGCRIGVMRQFIVEEIYSLDERNGKRRQLCLEMEKVNEWMVNDSLVMK